MRGALRNFLAFTRDADLTVLFRRYFVNTLFDSTFVVLGIIVASALSVNPNLQVTLGTMAAACLALGISTGVSVYEAETVESDLRLRRLERAMLASLEDTEVERGLRWTRTAIALTNFSAPLLVLAVTSAPFLLATANVLPGLREAAEVAVATSIVIIFVAGVFLGRITGKRPIVKGLRMALVALGTFALLYALQFLF